MNLTGIEGAEGHEAVWGGDALYIEALADSSVSSFSNTSIAPEKHTRVIMMPKGTDSQRWIFLIKCFM